MAKITKMKANETASTVRVTLGVSYNDLVDVRAFNPSALTIADKDGNVTFKVVPRDAGSNYISVSAVDVLPGAKPSEPVSFVVTSATSSRVDKAVLAKIQANLATIETQVKAEIKTLEGATIEEC